jgi:hypothetical protein
MHGSMPRASIVGLFCFSGVCVCAVSIEYRETARPETALAALPYACLLLVLECVECVLAFFWR